MKTVLLASLSFAALMVVPALLLTGTALLAQGARRPSAADDFLLATYLVVVATFLSTVGFMTATVFSARWRGLGVWRAVVIAGALGLIAPVVTLFGAGLGPVLMLPLFRSAPRVATILFYLVPGLVLGVAALLIARVRPVRPSRLPPE